MAIDNELHTRALKEFGYGYMNPTRATDVLTAIFERIDKAEARIAELESQLEQVSTGRAISMTLQLKTRKVADSIEDLRSRMNDTGLPGDSLPPEVYDALIGWLADQFETVPTPGAAS